MDAFRLRKWYLDCVTPQGEVFIGYWARLSLGGLDLRYCSRLGAEGDAASSFRPSDEPRVLDGHLAWSCRPLDLEGRWEARCPPCTLHLHERQGRDLTWACLQPASAVELDLGGRRLRGDGYAERLDLGFGPWHLPFEELRWGRFAGGGASLVWIGWRGSAPRTWTLLDGREVAGGRVEEDRVSLPGATLELEVPDRLVIRDAPVLPPGLLRFPALTGLVPASFSALRERKWRSSGVLRREGAPDVRGWVIHETVGTP